MLGLAPHDFPFPDYAGRKTKADVLRTCIKMNNYFREHDNILISVSGGSDSDCIVHLVCKYFPEYINKCHFVFVNTGLEYDATKRHLNELESKYDIKIERIRGMSVVTSCRQFGFPILNKAKSKSIDLYLRNKPKGYYLVFEANGSIYHFTEKERELVTWIKENGIKVSNKCCDVSKKKPLYNYIKQNGIDLSVTGERKAEGGLRATAHKSCFEEHKDGMHKYMPIFWWSDETKADFKAKEGIHYSDCYEVWGMKRTGCVGCPFGKDTAEELELIHHYEPKLYKAVMSIFGQAYELTDKFNCRRKKCLPDSLKKEGIKNEII